ncbi:MAG: histidine kinase [Lysobacterales bacterium 69-70]|nr:HAMP domain-containing protein [Xanthomonadaceae bacterium]ODU35813.1 MAG: histidine kinase [Xanthomonadaceae bacterium SCN 69-320]ODV17453.1 MAG: histidine kinase [Xanthomonadaceae bacterium SCN 69-25]OJY97299.1 MAG: histidine kinase [Xanthomonadales bacterium 69-70]
MSLRRKLLLVALAMLALPWAGWQFLRQMEVLLRQGQEQTLIASGKALTRSLTAINAELPPPGDAVYVHELDAPLQIDGYADDWIGLRAYSQNLGPAQDAQKLKLTVAEDAAWMYLLIEVRDTTRRRADARDVAVAQADRIELGLDRGGAERRYLIASAAPGSFDALARGADGAGLPVTLGGEWQEDAAGYRVELRLPRAQRPERLSLHLLDAGGNGDVTLDRMPLLAYSDSLAAELAQFAPESTRARLLSSEGWLLAESGGLDTAAAASSAQEPSALARWSYRWLIAPALQGSATLAERKPRVDAPELWQALSGVPATSWRAGSGQGDVVLVAALPLQLRGETRGALVLEQVNTALPLLTDAALQRLALISVAALLLAGGVLFVFATWLSVRIRRLRDGAERALAADGRIQGRVPLTDTRDELGDLARSFQQLLDAVGAYTDYLRTLASKLSHELHTPLAIVKSSLDNLEHHPISSDARAYVLRARDGVDRLTNIVRAMSESSRMERAIASADAEDFDLAEVVRGCAEAYRPLVAPRRIDCEVPVQPVPMHGAPELIAQALDKLVDNARSFTPEHGWIRIALEAGSDGIVLRVANFGPELPLAMQGRLFDSLVSLREGASRGEAPHLGLGLYVVRLVAERHGGSAAAHNLAGGDGVEFSLRLRGMPRVAAAARGGS